MKINGNAMINPAEIPAPAAAGAGSAFAAEQVAKYDDMLAPARQRFDQHAAVEALFRKPLESVTMERFLIYFSAVGVRMTKPVEGWIRRAGKRCGEIGLPDLARALEAHAKQEADHHLLMEADVRRLVSGWNERNERKLNAGELLSLSPTPGVTQYCELHEHVITGATPFGQLAIEYEIELLSVAYGPALLRRCTDLSGPEILEGLSFLQDHVALDVGHTHFNRLQLSRLLEQHPAFVSSLAVCGSAALDAYVAFLDDCFKLASRKES
jgi:hypothetical protein